MGVLRVLETLPGESTLVVSRACLLPLAPYLIHSPLLLPARKGRGAFGMVFCVLGGGVKDEVFHVFDLKCRVLVMRDMKGMKNVRVIQII